MTTGIRRITEDQYNRAVNGVLAKEDMDKVFTMSELCGYGVYSTQVVKLGDGYGVKYVMGDTCD